jgi:hypothetical protein
MDIVNLTPHPIVLRGPNPRRCARGECPVDVDVDGSCCCQPRTVDTTIPASGTIARVQMTEGTLVALPGLPCLVSTGATYGAVEGLPAPAEGTIYVVSGRVLSALAGSGRDDVYGPGTGPTDGAVRDAEARIVAVTRLVRAS